MQARRSIPGLEQVIESSSSHVYCEHARNLPPPVPVIRSVMPWVAAAVLAGAAAAAAATALTVSAASSLTTVMRELAPLFEAAHPGTRLRLNFGGSGALLQQIDKGAPVDVFASADVETMNQALAKGLVRVDARQILASNRLVVVVPAGATNVPANLQALSQPVYRRIAIGLPASVPVGRYTRAALERAGLWATIEPRMVGAHSERQALDYVARGEVDAGFVYATEAALMADKVRVALTVATPMPVVYPVAAVASSPNPEAAQRFIAFLHSAPARALLLRHGFGPP